MFPWIRCFTIPRTNCLYFLSFSVKNLIILLRNLENLSKSGIISDMSSVLLLFRFRRHLLGVFRSFYGPFWPPPGPLWTLWGSTRISDTDRPDLRFSQFWRTSYSGRLPPYKGEAAKPPGPYSLRNNE